MPKVHPEENSLSLRVAARDKIKTETEAQKEVKRKQQERDLNKLSGLMQAEALNASDGGVIGNRHSKPTGGAVKLKGLVPVRKGGIGISESDRSLANQIHEVSSTSKQSQTNTSLDDLPNPPQVSGTSNNSSSVITCDDVAPTGMVLSDTTEAGDSTIDDEDEPPPIF